MQPKRESEKKQTQLVTEQHPWLNVHLFTFTKVVDTVDKLMVELGVHLLLRQRDTACLQAKFRG
jgi:hypothetical protein